MPSASSAGPLVGLFAVLLLVLAGCGTSDQAASATPDRADSSAAAGSAGFRHYVALGDSYTAAPLVPVTDVANGCFRSSGNYPALVAEALGVELDDRSCGGATTRDLRKSQHPEVPPQFSALDRRTDLVTLSIGGNDGGVFRRMIEGCTRQGQTQYQRPACRARVAVADGQRDRLLAALARTRSDLVEALREISRLAPQALVLVVGYPRIVDSERPCRLLPLPRGDYRYVEQVNRALDSTLRYASRPTGATYVDVWTASRGHDICAEDPWINGARADPDRAAAYHPFAEGQRAVADLVLEAARQSGPGTS